jgi:hypothetical protein
LFRQKGASLQPAGKHSQNTAHGASERFLNYSPIESEKYQLSEWLRFVSFDRVSLNANANFDYKN